MKKSFLLISIFFFVSSILACANATRQQKGTAIGAGTGAAVGAAVGQAIGRDTQGTLWGAGIGAAVGGLAGWQISSYMDRQEQALRQAVGQSEAMSVQRDQDVLTASFQNDFFFDFDSAALKPGARSEIDRVAQILKNYPQTVIRIEGHTDASGTEEYNQKLSQLRAETVKNALIDQGVDPRRLQAVGYGESRPVSSSAAMNRRVELVIQPIRQG